jgi:hypothetical protein
MLTGGRGGAIFASTGGTSAEQSSSATMSQNAEPDVLPQAIDEAVSPLSLVIASSPVVGVE